MKVLKFGGTSMGSADSLQKVCEIIQKNFNEKKKIVVTCSAMSGVTDAFLEIGEKIRAENFAGAEKIFAEIREKHFSVAQKFGVEKNFKNASDEIFQNIKNLIRGIELIREISEQTIACFASFGEKLSTRLLAEILKNKKIPAEQFDADFVRTAGENFLEDEILWDETIAETKKILGPAIEKKVPIVAGFFGRNPQRVISLLGRGGTDFSGAIFAVALQIKILEIWTDVDGFLSADPRIVPNAKIIDEIGFEEVSELCFFGAKVLHPKTIRPVIEMGGEVWIKNTFNSSAAGTKIARKISKNKCAISSISSKKVAMITLDIFGSRKKKLDVFAELFLLARENKIFVDMIAASEAQISFCVKNDPAKNKIFLEDLQKIAPAKIFTDCSIICIVSPENVQGKFGVAANFFAAIAAEKISIAMYSQNASELAQLVVVKNSDEKSAIRAIHKKLIC